MDKEQINSLLRLYFTNQATHKEREALFDELQRNNNDTEWEDMLLSILQQTPPDEDYDPAYWQQRINQITEHKAKVIPLVRRRKWYRIAAAAVILIAIGITVFVTLSKNTGKQPVAKTPASIQNDVLPGGNKAILTLDGGKNVILDSAKNGALAVQGNTQVIKGDGTLAYNQQQQVGITQNPVYNTVTTPRGGQYQLTLADGSQVWLNAASSIRFPTAFTGSQRVVEITGEAYFEVAHDASKPFHVTVNGMDVQVLGTHFNINAYADEDATRVTLLQGSVKVSNGGGAVQIKPGEQATLTSNLKPQTSNNVDLDQVMAWKNGVFNFDGANLQTIMRQIARWYDVDVVYQGTIPNEPFKGKINRNVPASKVLQMLEYLGVHFKIEGKKIIVTP